MQDNSILPLFSPQPETREIPLTRGMIALVDAADYEWLSRWKWHAHKSRSQWYACRWTRIDGKPRTIRMHREIIDAQDGVIVDHVNRNSLDNRRVNLRPSNHRENYYNSAQYEMQCASIDSNVAVTASLRKKHTRWAVTITISRLPDKQSAYDVREKVISIIREAVR